MTRRSITLLAVLLAVVTAVAPVQAHDTVSGTPDVTITLRNGLSDRDVRVGPGAIVRFVNADAERHRLRSRSGAGFDTGNIEPGDSAQIRVGAPGTYAYIDERDDGNSRYHGRIRVAGDRGGTTATGTTATGTTGGAPTKTATVTIGDRNFQPAATRIVVGGSVTFRNDDSDEHTATGGIIDSGALSPGTSYTKTFPEAGTYDFLCIFHPEMQGTVEVIGETAAASTPTASPLPTAVSSEAGEGPAVGAEASIDIVDLAFEPATVEVSSGTTVRWTNTGVAPHTATAEDGSFDSGMLDSGATFERTFSTPGTFAYACQVHPDMSGTVEVTATAAAPPSSVDSVESAALEGGPPATPKPPAADDVDAVPAAADLGSMGDIALAVLMISIASALFARLLRDTVRPIDP